MKRLGFQIDKKGQENPTYTVKFADNGSLECYSKLYNDPVNPQEDFAAIMTCAHADQNCPIVSGAEVRLPVRYEAPKLFDGTPLEAEKYDELSLQIASEMFYVFCLVKHRTS